jgi:hypothetical protein
VRVPTVLLRCKVMAGAAVILMTAGTLLGSPEARAWAVLVAIFAAGLGIGAAIRSGTEAIKAYVHRWSLETFEHGFKQGVEQGREMEAAERLMSSLREN